MDTSPASPMPFSAGHAADCPLLIVLSAPSGGGKTTLCQRLLAQNPTMARAITCTTRAPRPGERDGVDYYFLEPAAFAQRVAAGAFLEHAIVYGCSYGTLAAEVRTRLAQRSDVLLAIDVQGAAAVRAQAAQDPALRRSLVTVFLTPPSLAVLAERLRKRAQDAPATIERRLAVARTEIERWVEFDYLIMSDTIEADARRAQSIVDAERLRQSRSRAPQV